MTFLINLRLQLVTGSAAQSPPRGKTATAFRLPRDVRRLLALLA